MSGRERQPRGRQSMQLREFRWRKGYARYVRYFLWVAEFAGIGVLVHSQPLLAQQTTVATHVTTEASRVAEELLARRITIALTHASLERALDSISSVAKVFFEYQSPMIEAYTTSVTLNVTDVPLGVVLDRVLDGTALRVVSGGRGNLTIVATPATAADSEPQLGIVTGRVVDSATGRALDGATVRVVGTKTSAVTADSGRFTLHDVQAGDHVLTIRLFGYRVAERSVMVVGGERVVLRVSLKLVPTVLSGMVTTASGMQRKVEVGSDITTLNADSIVKTAPVSSVTDLLETRVPGLIVQRTSGVPGAPKRLRLRGASSITGNNDPIVVVDGVQVYSNQSNPRNDNLAPVSSGAVTSSFGGGDVVAAKQAYSAPSPLDQIDVNSIETIEVLKGPSATAIYGSDAANGVIVVTTKHGRAGPTLWDMTLGQGVNWLPGNWPVHTYRFGSSVFNNTGLFGSAGLCYWNDLSCSVDSAVAFQALNNPQFSVFGHGSDQTASFTVSGGVPTVTYSLSGSAQGDVGNLKLPPIEQQRYVTAYSKPSPAWMRRPDNYTTYGGTGQLALQPSPLVHLTLSSSLFRSHQQQGSLQAAISQLEGKYIPSTYADTAIYVPLIANDAERTTDDQLTLRNALTASWTPVPWLPLQASGGIETIQRTDETLVPYGINVHGIGVTAFGSHDTSGFYGLGQGTSQNITLNASTSIPMRLIATGLGINVNRQSTRDLKASTDQLSPGVDQPTAFLNSQDITSTFTQFSTAISTYGWFLEPRLAIASRFFVNPGFRLDGGSGSGKNGGIRGSGLSGFPKINLSWIAVDQDHPRGILTLLRPRLAFGYAGTPPGPAQKLRLLNSFGPDLVQFLSTVQLNDSTTAPIVQISTLGNTQLQPERKSELEGGMDVDLWSGRFSLTYTHFSNTLHNAIISVPVAPSVSAGSGQVFSIYKNIGVIRNTGTEMTVNTQVLGSRALSWNIHATLTNDDNRVVRLNPGFAPDKVLGIVPGFPLFSAWSRPIVAFADANQNGLIDPTEIRYGDDSVYVGQQTPKYKLDFATGVTLLDGHLSINAGFDYQNGMTQFPQLTGLNSAFLNSFDPRTTPLATQAAVIAAACKFGLNEGSGFLSYECRDPTMGSDIGMFQTISALRFNDLSVNYTLPTTVTRRFRVPHMAVVLQGSNLGLHTNYRGKDPNVNAFSTVSGGDQTRDLGQIPQPRTWWLKLFMGN